MKAAIEAVGLGQQVRTAAGEHLTLLEGINLKVQAGETVAIVGKSGSGKTTLLSLLAGLDRASSGEVLLLGEPLSRLDEDGRASLRAQQVGFVFQNFQLLNGFTALENVLLPLELAGHASPRAAAEASLASVGLSHRLQHYPQQLSGGQQQRVALARAFAGNPRLLFADEPTGNLDAATGAKIIDLLFAMNQERAATLVLVTHDPALAARCSRLLTLADGRLQ